MSASVTVANGDRWIRHPVPARGWRARACGRRVRATSPASVALVLALVKAGPRACVWFPDEGKRPMAHHRLNRPLTRRVLRIDPGVSASRSGFTKAARRAAGGRRRRLAEELRAHGGRSSTKSRGKVGADAAERHQTGRSGHPRSPLGRGTTVRSRLQWPAVSVDLTVSAQTGHLHDVRGPAREGCGGPQDCSRFVVGAAVR